MDRRNFLKNTSFTGFVLSSPLISAAGNNNSLFTSQILNYTAFELTEATIDDLQNKMQSGSLTSRKITELYLNRIRTIDKDGIRLNSVIEINPDALFIAESMDKERKAGKLRGRLHGIPVLIKDNINTADKMQTTAGSLALQGHKASSDAYIVKKLRDSGA